MFFSEGRRKSYDCFATEVPLKNRTLWGYRSTYLYGPRKGASPHPGYLHNLGPLEFLRQKFSAFFQRDDFFEEISKLPTNKDLAFVAVPFSLTLR